MKEVKTLKKVNTFKVDEKDFQTSDKTVVVNVEDCYQIDVKMSIEKDEDLKQSKITISW